MTAEKNGFSVIGKPFPKPDAVSKVTGRAVYADDMLPARTLHCRILRSPHPHARIVSIDTSAARRMAGGGEAELARGRAIEEPGRQHAVLDDGERRGRDPLAVERA